MGVEWGSHRRTWGIGRAWRKWKKRGQPPEPPYKYVYPPVEISGPRAAPRWRDS